MWLERILEGVNAPWRRRSEPPRDRLKIEPSAPVYAVGDVHGCFDELLRLEDDLIADARTSGAGEPLVVMLGDYVDRGPKSSEVLDHLIVPQTGFRRLCLAGNHEIYFQRFLDSGANAASWCAAGGAATLWSYGIDPGLVLDGSMPRRKKQQLIDSHIPDEHRSFLRQLPVLIETPDWLFVHAGLRRDATLKDQRDSDLTETRPAADMGYEGLGRVVVHGHTVTDEPVLSATRISVDTGAYMTGRLSAVRLEQGVAPKVISVRPAS